MLLAIDIGNTNIVLGLWAGQELQHTFRISTQLERTLDEHYVLLSQLLGLRGIAADKVTAAIIASVVPSVTEVVAGSVRRAFARDPMIVGGPGLKTGIAVRYDSPKDVGADRIVNAVAAFERFKSGAIVVDFGTATTFDCISEKAEYLGGVIVPGVHVALNGLLAHTAKLTRVEIAAPPSVLGKSTPHALQSGIVHGHAALVDGMVDRLVNELGFPCKVIATGGLAKLIVQHTTRVDSIDENLTLEGLRVLHERNSS